MYCLDPNLAANPVLKLNYDDGLFFNMYHNEASMHCKTTFGPNSNIYIQSNASGDHYTLPKIVDILQSRSDVYTRQKIASN